ncbi:MAG: hypothetical protein ACERK6_11435, partial [Candidatus Aminicenantaceae bacterium]
NFLVLFFISLFGLMAFLGSLFLVVRIAFALKDYYFYELEVYTLFNGELDEVLIKLLPWTTLILLLPLVVAFVWAFRKWDARPARVHNLRFSKALVPLGAVALIVAVLFLNLTLNIGFRILYLTRDHQLVENHAYSGLKIYDGQHVHKIRELGEYVWGFGDHEGALFLMTHRGIASIDLSDYSQTLLYECPPGREIEGGYRYFDGTLAFFTQKRTGKDRRFELLDLSSGSLKTVEWDLAYFSRYVRPWLFAADTEGGERFWFFRLRDQDRKQHVYRLWEDGRYEHVAESLDFPLVVNRMLVTSSEEDVILSRLEDGRYQTFKKIANPEGFRFGNVWFREMDQNLVTVSEIYGYLSIRRPDRRSEYRFARLDLEDLSIQPAENMRTWNTQFGRGDHYLIERPDGDSQDLNIYRLHKGESTFLKTLARIDPQKYEYKLGKFATGLIIEKGKRVMVFSVPALEELKFKKFN